MTTSRQLSQIDLPFFREVQHIQAEPEPQEKGDILDALIVGLDMLCRFCGTKKYRKRIFLITDGEKGTEYAEEEVSQIVETIKENDVKLNAITLDFCNDLAEYDSQEDEENENKPSTTKENGETDAQQNNRDFLTNL